MCTGRGCALSRERGVHREGAAGGGAGIDGREACVSAHNREGMRECVSERESE